MDDEQKQAIAEPITTTNAKGAKWAPRTISSLWLALMAGIAINILDSALFFRLSPFAEPYVMDLSHYYFHQIFYAWYGVALISLPFILLQYFLKRGAKILYIAQAVVLFVTIFLTQLDHEIMRYMGVHIGMEFITTYFLSLGLNAPDAMWISLAKDAGGSYVSVLLGIVPILYAIAAFLTRKWRFDFVAAWPRRIRIGLIAAVVIVTLFLPFFFRTSLFGGKLRQHKVAPYPIVFYTSILDALQPAADFSHIAEDVAAVKLAWKDANTDNNWQFDDPLTLHKHYNGECKKPAKRPNFVVISIETGRAWNIKLFNPEAAHQSMPFLESLATSEHGTYYKRFYSNGQPTVFSFMTMHTSIPPHSYRTVAKTFTSGKFESFASILRRNGYHAAFFCGSDPDWDQQRFWLKSWYDSTNYNPDFDEKDRLVMADMADYLKALPDDQPFVATAFLISNHIPFENPEEKLNITSTSDYSHRIYNTLRYDDDVISDFFDAIRDEPWFEDTVFFITGDHGYDLGERGDPSGHTNSRHEGIWVPLVVYSHFPTNLPRGPQQHVASHIDVAPTILQIAGICEPNDFWGHSLLAVDGAKNVVPNIKDRYFAYETSAASFYLPPDGSGEYYDDADILQKQNLAEQNTDKIEKSYHFMRQFSTAVDYFYEVARQ